jgi:signal transduction histidine kinase
LALLFTVPGAALLFAAQPGLGNVIYVIGTLVAAYGILTHRLPDVRRSAQTAWSFTIVTLLTVALYAVGFVMAPAAFAALPSYPPWLVAGGLALILAVLLNPLLAVVRRVVNRLIRGSRYDARRTVGEYSLSISNILDLERLTTVAIGLIHEAIGVQRGGLFLVDSLKDPNGADFYQLRGIRGLGDRDPANGTLAATSSVAEYLNQEYGPLTQYDIDLLPRFRALAPTERAWLDSLDMDVYVPIYTSGKWIGLFALGPKVSKDRFFDEDLQLLSTLADQTAVALQNARLVEDLVRLNNDIKQAYNALDQANQQLEHLDRAKSDFINIVSHELRTPVTVLHGYSQILLADMGARANVQHIQLMQGMHSGTTRLMEIIESMLDMAKIDGRTLQLNPNPVYMPPLMRSVLEGLEKAIAERNITLEVGDLTSLPPVEVDLSAIQKVFYHLIINAIKFTPDGGQIAITGRHLKPDDTGSLPGGALQVVVADTGIGIDPKYLELIFTKFYQTGEVALHSTGKTKFKGGGPGLGLAIARGIVEAHGGRIWAESPGYDEENFPGSHFFVAIPLRQPRATPLKADLAALPVG